MTVIMGLYLSLSGYGGLRKVEASRQTAKKGSSQTSDLFSLNIFCPFFSNPDSEHLLALVPRVQKEN